MKGRSIPVLPILLMLGIAYCAYWFYKNTEYAEEETSTRTSMEARKFDFLIAAKLLESQGFQYDKAKHIRQIYNLDIDDTGVLLVDNLKVIEDERSFDAILDWVIAGGILITGTNRVYDDNDLHIDFLDKVGIYYQDDNAQLVQIDIDQQNDSDEQQGSEELYLQVPDEAIPNKLIKVSPVGKTNISYLDNNAVANTRNLIDSSQLVHNAVGKGYVAVLSDADPFSNKEIGKEQHGFLLLWLTQPAKSKTMRYVSYLGEPPGLLGTLWISAPIVIATLLIVLAGYLRMAASRLGPIEYEELPNKNNLMAHLRARGEFWYKHRHTETQFAEIQQAALSVLAKRRGESGIRQQNEEINEQAVAVQASELVDCTPATAKAFLFDRVSSSHTILKSSQYLQKILHLNTNKLPKSK